MALWSTNDIYFLDKIIYLQILNTFMEECKLSGVCCRLFYINLTKEEYSSKTFKTQFEEFGFVENFEEAQEYGANVLSKKEDGSCIYLADNKCSIHSRRPNACRDFFCT